MNVQASDSLARRLARFACRLNYQDLTDGQVDRLKDFFLDWLGSAIAGRSEAPVRMIREVAEEMGGRPEATVIPDGTRTSAPLAALVNGASSHVKEMDDLHRESILHPAAAIMPAVFAMAEREDVTGPDLIVGIAVGYEIGIRVALAAGPDHYRYWHTTATCGTFGAAAGACRILGLDEDRTVWALGSAGTQASGLWQFLTEGAMSKQLHPGKAAMNGLLAALLARKGFTGAEGILEGEKGFLQATSTDFDGNRCLDGLGHEFRFERNSLKYHASCGHTHAAVDAVLQASQGETWTDPDVREVKVRTYQAALDLLGGVNPDTPYAAKFSLPYCLAAALKFGRVGVEEFDEACLRDADLRRLMDKIILNADPELDRTYPAKWPARVEITLNDGRALTGSVDYPKGDPEHPLSQRELRQKFENLTHGLLSVPVIESIYHKSIHLEQATRVSRLLEDI